MKKEHSPRYGAYLERGKITAIQTNNGTVTGYTVESYDRPGITAEGLNGSAVHNADVNTNVYFYLFDDGTGFILRPM